MENTLKQLTHMQTYYQSLGDEKKQAYKNKIIQYQKQRYNNDETYRQKVCEAKKAKYEMLKSDPERMKRMRINAFVYGLNMRAWAGVQVKKTKKFEEYDIVYNEFDGCYMSKILDR